MPERFNRRSNHFALFKTAMVGALRKAMPYVAPVGSWLMVIAGSYIVFYWLSLGGLLD